MLRSATADALGTLINSAFDIDRELDMALIRLGVLPPLDLSVIRSWLTLDGVGVRARSGRDGHRVIDVLVDRRVVASIGPDGTVAVPIAVPA